MPVTCGGFAARRARRRALALHAGGESPLRHAVVRGSRVAADRTDRAERSTVPSGVTSAEINGRFARPAPPVGVEAGSRMRDECSGQAVSLVGSRYRSRDRRNRVNRRRVVLVGRCGGTLRLRETLIGRCGGTLRWKTTLVDRCRGLSDGRRPFSSTAGEISDGG